jgi:VIT1/CCC1 family predicted Fe2+/Mn2+ transporter
LSHDDPDLSAASSPASPGTQPRPWLERLGLAGIAVVMTALFAVVAVAFWSGGEWILAATSAAAALVTLVVGLATLVRG